MPHHLQFVQYAYYKVIPEMLELPEDVTLFVLSYYNFSYTLFGDILASVVTTQVRRPAAPFPRRHDGEILNATATAMPRRPFAATAIPIPSAPPGHVPRRHRRRALGHRLRCVRRGGALGCVQCLGLRRGRPRSGVGRDPRGPNQAGRRRGLAPPPPPPPGGRVGWARFSGGCPVPPQGGWCACACLGKKEGCGRPAFHVSCPFQVIAAATPPPGKPAMAQEGAEVEDDESVGGTPRRRRPPARWADPVQLTGKTPLSGRSQVCYLAAHLQPRSCMCRLLPRCPSGHAWGKGGRGQWCRRWGREPALRRPLPSRQHGGRKFCYVFRPEQPSSSPSSEQPSSRRHLPLLNV